MNPNITKVYLLNVPLENDYKNTLYFTSRSNQQSFFESRIVKSYTDFSYQRKDSIIRVPAHFDELQNVNYVMYQNSNYSNKWYYAFITDMKYIDDGRTDLVIETDFMQTWFFDITVKASFVEREHVSDDTVGIHTVPEGLEMGETIVNNVIHGKNLFSPGEIVVGSTIDLSHTGDGKFPNINGNQVGGIYSGVKYYHFNNINSLNTLLKRVAEEGQSDGIVTIFMGNSDFYDLTEVEGKAYSLINDSFNAKEKEFDYTVMPSGGESYTVSTPEKPTQVNGYTPRNKKLLTFPFCFLYVSNNSGGSAIYKYEYFSGTKTQFKYFGCLTPGMSIRFLPLNYNNQAINNDEGINCGKLPICAWNTDVYTNWLTQNSVNIGLSLASGLFTILSPNPVDDIAGIYSVTQTLGQMYQHSLIPPQVEGNINSGDVTASSGQLRVSLFQKSIRQEYAKIIDKFFDMFGYKVNMVKVPNKAHRSRWWYTKTIDVNIDGAIPNKDMKVIKDCYNRGITFWRNANEIENYDLSNTIV